MYRPFTLWLIPTTGAAMECDNEAWGNAKQAADYGVSHLAVKYFPLVQIVEVAVIRYNRRLGKKGANESVRNCHAVQPIYKIRVVDNVVMMVTDMAGTETVQNAWRAA